MAALPVTQIDPSSSSSVYSADNVVPIGNRSSRLIVAEPEHDWRLDVISRLEELVRLPRGWDGYAGEPVSLLNANFALRMLEIICSPKTQVPQIVPGSSGDLQIEWHTPSGDIELHVRGPNDVLAWHGDGQELPLTNNFIDVAAWIEDLERPSAAAAAA
jgi:hypothetical protein